MGRLFVNPLVDYLLIGCGLSLPILALIRIAPELNPARGGVPFWIFIIINGAHFAASSVRLYADDDVRQQRPFLSWAFPVLCFAVVGLSLAQPRVSSYVEALFYTWSPYHYAAQTYGLAVMYAMRSGARLSAHDKQQMWLVCMLPFVYSLLTTPAGGFGLLLRQALVAGLPVMEPVLALAARVVAGAVLLLPVSLFWQLHRSRGRSVPLISLLLQVTNGIWWLGAEYPDAWFWSALFHSLQYLIVATAMHVNQRSGAAPRHLRLLAGASFYGTSLGVGALLFLAVPLVYMQFGFTVAASFTTVSWVINLHHFIVDGFVWRSRPARGTAPPRPELTTAAAF